jgi:hypothetical protein
VKILDKEHVSVMSVVEEIKRLAGDRQDEEAAVLEYHLFREVLAQIATGRYDAKQCRAKAAVALTSLAVDFWRGEEE